MEEVWLGRPMACIGLEEVGELSDRSLRRTWPWRTAVGRVVLLMASKGGRGTGVGPGWFWA